MFSKLVLWIDDNHDGISQPSELHGLSEFGIQGSTRTGGRTYLTALLWIIPLVLVPQGLLHLLRLRKGFLFRYLLKSVPR